MGPRRLSFLLALGILVAVAAPAAAQVPPPDDPRRPEIPPGAELEGSPGESGGTGLFWRFSKWYEDRCGTLAGGWAAAEGCRSKHWSFHVGSLGSKSGFFGLGFGLHNNLIDPTGFKVGFTTAATWRAYQNYTAYVGVNDPVRKPSIRLTGFYDVDRRNSFWGLGPDTDENDDADYAQEQWGARLDIGMPPTFPAWARGGLRYEKSFVGEGHNPDLDDAEDAFPDVPGVDEPQLELWGPWAEVVLDLTNAPRHPIAGIKLKGRVHAWRSADDQNFNWTTIGAEAQGHLPLGTRWFVLSAVVGYDEADPEDPGDEIPFNYLPSLGGSERLRGYPTWRWTDLAAAYGTVELRYRIWEENTEDPNDASAFEGALFYDVGGVASGFDDLDLFDQDSYGLEIRTHFARRFAFRFGVGHSDEGTRFNFKAVDIY